MNFIICINGHIIRRLFYGYFILVNTINQIETFMEKSKRVATAERFIQDLDLALGAPNISNDNRTWFGVACLEVARETYKAIVLCVAKSLLAPAFALLRTEYESYVRGIYLLQCASDKELSLVKRDGWNPKITDLISSVEKLEKYNDGALSEMKTKSWVIMNSFTHTGLLQIVRRRSKLAIEPDYSDEEVDTLFNVSGSLGALVYLEIAFVSDRTTGGNELANRIRSVSNSYNHGVA